MDTNLLQMRVLAPNSTQEADIESQEEARNFKNAVDNIVDGIVHAVDGGTDHLKDQILDIVEGLRQQLTGGLLTLNDGVSGFSNITNEVLRKLREGLTGPDEAKMEETFESVEQALDRALRDLLTPWATVKSSIQNMSDASSASIAAVGSLTNASVQQVHETVQNEFAKAMDFANQVEESVTNAGLSIMSNAFAIQSAVTEKADNLAAVAHQAMDQINWMTSSMQEAIATVADVFAMKSSLGSFAQGRLGVESDSFLDIRVQAARVAHRLRGVSEELFGAIAQSKHGEPGFREE